MEETLNNKVRVLPPKLAAEYDGQNLPKNNRYKWISLDVAEPNLGIPAPESAYGGQSAILERVINSYGLSAVLYPISYVEGADNVEDVSIYNDLKIDINLDLTTGDVQTDPNISGTIDTLSQLLKPSSPLINLLLPFYGNDLTLLLDNVRINSPGYSFVMVRNSAYPQLTANANTPGNLYTEPNYGNQTPERTISWLASSFTVINTSNRKITFNFADEAAGSGDETYYGNSTRDKFNPLSALKTNFVTDVSLLTGALVSRRASGAATTRAYDVCLGKGIYSTTWSDSYYNFLYHVKNGGGSFSNFNLNKFEEYNIDRIARGATIGYYTNFIMLKLKEAGYSYPGSYLADNYYVTSDLIGNRGFDAFPSADATQFTSDERPDLPTLEAAIDELLYIKPQFTTFTLNNSSSVVYVQPKQTIEPALLRWLTNKKTNASIVKYDLTLPSTQTLTFNRLNRFDFRNVSLSVSGAGYSVAPVISTFTPNPLSTFEVAILKPIMDGTNLIGVSVVDPGEYATYDINVLFLPNGASPTTEPEIRAIGLNKKAAAPQLSYNLNTIGVSSRVSSVSSYKIKATDWKGTTSTEELKIESAGYIYYGLSTVSNMTSTDIINGVNEPFRGSLKVLSGKTQRSYSINCNGGPSGGFHFYIAYPAYIPRPGIIIRGYPVESPVLSNILVPYEGRPDLDPIPYNVVISNNRQNGANIPINVS